MLSANITNENDQLELDRGGDEQSMVSQTLASQYLEGQLKLQLFDSNQRITKSGKLRKMKSWITTLPLNKVKHLIN